MPSAAAASVGEDDDEDDEGKEGDDENSKSDEKDDAVFGGFEESRVEAAPEAKAEAAPNPTAAAAPTSLTNRHQKQRGFESMDLSPNVTNQHNRNAKVRSSGAK